MKKAIKPSTGIRTGMTVDNLKQSFIDNLLCGMGRVPRIATLNDLYTALSLTVRDRMLRKVFKR